MKCDPPERRRSPDFHSGTNIATVNAIPYLAFGLVPVLAATQSAANPVPGMPFTLTIAFMSAILLNMVFVAGGTANELLRPGHLRGHANPRVLSIARRQHQLVAACFLGSQTMRAWMVIMCFIPAPLLAVWGEKSFGQTGGNLAIFAWAVALSLPVAAVNVVAELIAKSYAVAHPLHTAVRLYGITRAAEAVFGIPGRMATFVASGFTRRFGGNASFAIANQAEEEIKTLLESAEETGEIEEEEKEMLHSVFEFGDTVAREVMTPRVDLDALPVTCSVHDVIHLIEESGHSRIPVYEDSDDQIVGIVHAKDILKTIAQGQTEVPLKSLMRDAIFVPENKPLHDLLEEMRVSRTQMVIVQDEFGGTAGVVTIEDVVEEVVGDIVDEYDAEEQEIVKDESGFHIEGRANLDDVNDEVGSSFDSDEFDTIGGYVFGLFGRQPKPGETIESEGYLFTVEDTDGRRIVKLLVSALEEHSDDADEVSSAPNA